MLTIQESLPFSPHSGINSDDKFNLLVNVEFHLVYTSEIQYIVGGAAKQLSAFIFEIGRVEWQDI